MSKFWRELWKILGSSLRLSSAYHPQTDGQTEAMNRVVEMVICCTLHEGQEGSSWERLLSTVEFAINNHPTQTTGYMPFYLNYGFHLCTPMDFIKDSDSTLMEGVDQFLERMKKNFSTAMKYLHRAQKRVKSQTDQKGENRDLVGETSCCCLPNIFN